jgi:hypothetical protein
MRTSWFEPSAARQIAPQGVNKLRFAPCVRKNFLEE